MEEQQSVQITPAYENLYDARNLRAHVLFAMLKTSQQLGKYPPIVSSIFKERFPEGTVNSKAFPTQLEAGAVSFTQREYLRLVIYVAQVFGITNMRHLKNALRKVIPKGTVYKDQQELERQTLFFMGKVISEYLKPPI
jgi:hypothetical protein